MMSEPGRFRDMGRQGWGSPGRASQHRQPRGGVGGRVSETGSCGEEEGRRKGERMEVGRNEGKEGRREEMNIYVFDIELVL